ncbi:MAG: RDD family protein, partial [Vicinamibacterales bacterium]|nr:RDD family protein [Vicinamibacterales bacterium]
MKCPKCAYLSLDDGDRCRHCGYEFSLIEHPEPGAPATPSRPRATPLNLPVTPRADAARLRPARPAREQQAIVDGALGRALERTVDGAPLDLPLFDAAFPQGRPLPPPQRPLGVRRPGHATPRPRPPQARAGAGVLPLEPELPAPTPSTGDAVTPVATATTRSLDAPRAGPWRRAAAALVDGCLVALVDLLCLYFTLRVSGLEPSEWDLLPVPPLLAFFVVLNGGYVVLLTASLGQTLGKMALGLEVIADGHPTVGVGRASLRTALSLVSLLAAGLGFAWALVGDGRTMHDRLAGTRVVDAA